MICLPGTELDIGIPASSKSFGVAASTIVVLERGNLHGGSSRRLEGDQVAIILGSIDSTNGQLTAVGICNSC